MRLAGFLDPDLVKVPLGARTKRDAISELLDLIVRKFPFLNHGAIEAAIAEREEVENTSVGRGFAFPHARFEGVDRMYIAVGVSPGGIDHQAPDGEPLRVMVLLLTPRNIARLYLQTLSAFMMLCRTPDLRARILHADTADAVMRGIWESGVQVENELLARDIMRRPVISVRPDATLRQVANLMYRHHISGMPVTDEAGRVVGEISERELIAAAIPDYAERAQGKKGARGEQPFEGLIQRENKLTVAQLMTPPLAVVDENRTVVELAALMLHKHIRRVIVANNGELVGLIMRSDIVNRVIRG
jgi:CBS domain-containing protein